MPESSDEGATLETIAVGTDGSATATKAVRFALELAHRYGARVVFISSYRPVEREPAAPGAEGGARGAPVVHQPGRGRRGHAARRGGAGRRARPEVDQRGARGRSGRRAGGFAEEHGADVLVIGNKGMHRRVLGSVPNSVSHKANCSVMIVKTT